MRFYEADTALQGIDLIYDRDLRVPDWISGCINDASGGPRHGTSPGRIGRVRSSSGVSARAGIRRSATARGGERLPSWPSRWDHLAAAAASGGMTMATPIGSSCGSDRTSAVRFQDVRGPLCIAQISDRQ